jgi:hypothetical protein
LNKYQSPENYRKAFRSLLSITEVDDSCHSILSEWKKKLFIGRINFKATSVPYGDDNKVSFGSLGIHNAAFMRHKKLRIKRHLGLARSSCSCSHWLSRKKIGDMEEMVHASIDRTITATLIAKVIDFSCDFVSVMIEYKVFFSSSENEPKKSESFHATRISIMLRSGVTRTG